MHIGLEIRSTDNGDVAVYGTFLADDDIGASVLGKKSQGDTIGASRGINLLLKSVFLLL